MKTWIAGGLVYSGRRMVEKDLCIEDGKIAAVCDPAGRSGADVYRADGKYVVPGFIDIHTHGGNGVDVNAAGKDDFQRIGHFFATQGTTSWLCSILTDTEEQTRKVIRSAVAHQKDHEDCAELLGIHLEGPFLSSEYRGAMPEYLLRKPDLELLKKYQDIAEGNIRYITVSPEVEGIPDAIPEIRKMGIVVAIGHSGADYETSWKCIRSGAAASTHTCNAMKLLHQHRPAIMGAVLESDIYCEVICDGRHLHPGTVRFILKIKGYDRVVAITDSIMAAGLPDGAYRLGVNDVVVEGGDARLKSDGTRAGSTLTTAAALRNLMEFTGKPIEDILPLLTENPARLLGVYNRIGSLEAGKEADAVILNPDITVCDTFVRGKRIKRE